MSDILDWLERLSELFILKLLTLGAWSKAYEQCKTIKYYEDYLHGQVSDELIVLTIQYSNVSSSAIKMFTPILGTPI
jgi:hypothetical protein